MALKFMKPVVEVSPVVAQEVIPQKVLVQPVSEVEAMTAEYVNLHKKFVQFEVKDLVKRMDEIRKSLQSIANETMEANKPAIFACEVGEVEFSARGKDADVPDPLMLIKDLLDKFGAEVTASVVDIAITPLRKLLSEHELKKYLVDVPGGRKVQAVRMIP